MGVELATENPGFYEMEDVNFTDSELAYHVRDALRSVPLGDSASYSELVGVICQPERLNPDEVALLVTSLKALSGAVSYIHMVHHEGLLSAIFGMNMWNYGPDVLDALVELIISLAASNGIHVDSCLEMLVSNFRPPKSFLCILKQPRGIAKKHHVLYRLHSALKDITDLVPLAALRLSEIITQRMPNAYIKEPKDLIVIYVENILRLESGALGEFVRSTVLKAVIDLLVDLDVEIDWEDILQDDSSKGIFQMELEELDEAADEAEKDDGLLPRESLIRKSLGKDTVAEILDSLLVLIFEHLQSCDDGGRLRKVFETILISFQATVLPAYKSKFAQFVMFFACSLDPEECGVSFPIVLADIFVCSSYSLDKRMSSVAYLASYLARGKFLPASLVISMLKRLVDWSTEYGQRQHGDISPTVHGVYYSACQAIMYVLCFRMRSMMDVPRLRSQLLMPIEHILKHPLNPLKVCLPCIVEEFLRQAKAARLFTVSEMFGFNDLLDSDLSRAFGGLKRLDMFFPFDPCLLKDCDSFIRPNYVYWLMISKTYDDVDCSSDRDDPDDFLDEIGSSPPHDEMGKSFDESEIDIDEFNCSLDKMSITPKNYKFANGLQASRQMPSRIRPSTSPESL